MHNLEFDEQQRLLRLRSGCGVAVVGSGLAPQPELSIAHVHGFMPHGEQLRGDLLCVDSNGIVLEIQTPCGILVQSLIRAKMTSRSNLRIPSRRTL